MIKSDRYQINFCLELSVHKMIVITCKKFAVYCETVEVRDCRNMMKKYFILPT